MAMPVLSMFYGIIIRMYFDDHNPPHFHAEYQGYKAQFDMDGNLLKGVCRNVSKNMSRFGRISIGMS